MIKKEFALQAIAPYYKDRSRCATVGDTCKYITPDGRKCVLGKYLIEPKDLPLDAATLLSEYGEDILVEEARGILLIEEWSLLQSIHDYLSKNSVTADNAALRKVDELGLFTIEELKQYCDDKLS